MFSKTDLNLSVCFPVSSKTSLCRYITYRTGGWILAFLFWMHQVCVVTGCRCKEHFSNAILTSTGSDYWLLIMVVRLHEVMCSLWFSLSLICHSLSSSSLPLFVSLLPSNLPFLSLNQETSSCLPARVAAAGNSAVRVALAAQKGKERESREGEERQRAGA